MILLVDNYDSFTFNIYQYVAELGANCKVVRNDKLTVQDVEDWAPEKIIYSPGPGRPIASGVMPQLISHFKTTPSLGICLGHQAIAEGFGSEIVKASKLMHGKTSVIEHDGKGVFKDMESPLEVMRYHSLVINPDKLSEDFEVTAKDSENSIMGIRHRELPLEGVQFHPESFATSRGKQMIQNFLEYS